MQQPNIKYDLNIPIWLMKDFSFNKKGTLLKRGVNYTQRTSRYAPVVLVVLDLSFSLLLTVVDYFLFISKLSCCFVCFLCPWRYPPFFITYL